MKGVWYITSSWGSKASTLDASGNPIFPGGYHSFTQYNTTSTDNDLFWVVINTYSDINNVDSSSAFAFANYLAFFYKSRIV